MKRYLFLASTYFGLVILANWLASRYVVSVGFGRVAPAGVFCIGGVLVLRDWLQQLRGLLWTMPLVYAAGLASWAIGDAAGWTSLQKIAVASVVAFTVSETVEAFLSLALGVATATAAAAISAGAATPWAYIVAGVGCLCLASVIVRFTARMASAGGLYTYIARGLHPNGGFIGGWLYGTAFAVGISFVLAIGGATMATLFAQHTSWSPSWFQCFLILLGGLLLFAFFDIRLSTRTQLVVGAAGVAAILLLAIIVLAKGGDSGLTIQPLNPANLPSTHGLFLAVGRAARQPPAVRCPGR